jgi:putative peptidoglycan lipid II flippase
VATLRAAVSEDVQVARHAGTVGAATLLSRILGLVREQVMATLFGAGFATDAFNVAFRIPNLLRDLFAEGAMSSAFVPTFTHALKTQGEEEAWTLGRQLFWALGLVLLAICAVGWWLAPALVRLFAPGFAALPGKLELTVTLTRVMLPFLPAVALAAAAMGMLNARGRFAVPALAPAVMNLVMVAAGLAFIPLCRWWGRPAILAMAVGVLVGGLAQFAFQLPALASEGFRLRFEPPRLHPGVLRVAGLMGPAAIGLAGTQINLMVSTWIASLLAQGSVSWLWYAFRLMQLPIGIFGVALATVSLPGLSRAAVDRDLPALKSVLSATVRLVFALTFPASLWLAVMARPVIALLYEHGHFHLHDTNQTAGALLMYCIGLPAFSAVTVFTRAFYALGETRTPVRASFVAVAVNLILNLLFIGPLRPLGLEHRGLALATSVTSLVNLAQLAWFLRRRIGLLEGRRMLDTAARSVAAAVVALLPSVIALIVLRDRWHGSLVREAALVLGSLVVSVGLGWGAMRALKLAELPALESLVGSVLGRRRQR